MTFNEKTVKEMEYELAHFKQSINEWVLYLNKSYKELEERLSTMERRLTRLELDNQLKL